GGRGRLPGLAAVDAGGRLGLVHDRSAAARAARDRRRRPRLVRPAGRLARARAGGGAPAGRAAGPRRVLRGAGRRPGGVVDRAAPRRPADLPRAGAAAAGPGVDAGASPTGGTAHRRGRPL
ncbi:MAG: hypothetical protein AVDCRST_MAG52-3062, partial [uncultured Blastococcus sp.]